MYTLTDEEWECVRVCVANAPIPYDITQKQIPANILKKIGNPTSLTGEDLPFIKLDLTRYEHE